MRSIPPALRRRLVLALRRVELAVVRAARDLLRGGPPGATAQVAAESKGDTIYSIDVEAEEVILPLLEEEIACETPFLLVAESISDEPVVLPPGKDPEIILILDPIDGTRGLMFDKRSAWCLAGIAPNLGPGTTLDDIEVAVQTEIPTSRSHVVDVLWAGKGEGAAGCILDLDTSIEVPLVPAPSPASTVRGGFAGLARFFPPAREALASIDDEVMRRALGDPGGRALVFEDQYISTGGQIHQLATGRDRFTADLRPLVYARQGLAGAGLSCHPYDLSTALVAREAGVIVRGLPSGKLDAPLDTVTPVAWTGYANARILHEIEPILIAILEERGLLEAGEARNLREISRASLSTGTGP